MPHKLVKFKKRKHKHSQWMTNGIRKSINYRDNLHNQLKRLKAKSFEHFIKTNQILKVSYRNVLQQPSYYTMNNCLTRVKRTQEKLDEDEAKKITT